MGQRVTTTSGCDYVKCPSFRGHNDHEIHCEGIMDGCRQIFKFRRVKEKQKQMCIFCESYQYEKCEMYRMIYEAKYAEEDE